MRVDSLPAIVRRGKMRRGQGRGSGSGHTSGRGNKGQKARGKVGLLFFGTKSKKSLVRRLPLLAGKGRMKGRKGQVTVRTERLAGWEKGERVDVASLIARGIVGKEAMRVGVKIVGGGRIGKAIEVAVPVSKGARKLIEKVGGKVRE